MGKILWIFCARGRNDTPQALAAKNQIRRTQWRTKIGAAEKGEEKLFAGQIEGVPALDKNMKTNAGAGDKI